VLYINGDVNKISTFFLGSAKLTYAGTHTMYANTLSYVLI